MRDVFQRELKEVQDSLVSICELVVIAIEKATESFQTSNVALSEEVISGEPEIDERASKLDELVIEILTRQQPVASDLRLMVTSLRVSASLERMGDLAEHIALLTRYRYPENVVPEPLRPTFVRMGQVGVRMAKTLVSLISTQDLSLIDQIRDLDDELDELHASVFDKVLSETFVGERATVVDATLASRYHERIGDHIVSIAKKIGYLVEGTGFHGNP